MDMPDQYRDRFEAGRALAADLVARGYAGRPDVLVLALPRGGIPVASEVARALRAPLDLFVVRKLGVPGQEELAMGAIASGGVRIINTDIVDVLRVPASIIDRVAKTQQVELERRERQYRGSRPVPQIGGKTVIIIDDGLATGSTMRAAVAALRQQAPARIVVAVPVAAKDTYQAFRDEVDEIVCPLTPERFHAVGQWYEDFPQTTDQEVRDLLDRAAQESRDTPAAPT